MLKICPVSIGISENKYYNCLIKNKMMSQLVTFTLKNQST